MSTYTQPDETRYWDCGCCGGAFPTARSEWYECVHPECKEREMNICAECIDCCRNCDGQFCSEHMDRNLEYCVTCRQQTEAA